MNILTVIRQKGFLTIRCKRTDKSIKVVLAKGKKQIMIDEIITMFSYSFMQKAIFVGALIALCASLLGVILVLKRYSMIGDGLSHVGFGALSLAVALNTAPLAVAMPVVIIAAFFLLRLNDKGKIKGDSAIALISSSSIAIGVIINAAAEGSNMDLNSYMFGSVLAMSGSDVQISIVLAIVVLSIFIIFYHRIFAITFDEKFAKATGIKTGFYNTLLAVLTAVTIVVGMRIMGTMLISSLIIFPALTSMRIFNNFRKVIISSGIISVVCFISGVILSYIYSFPTGACIVVANLAVFILFTLLGRILGKE